MNSKMMRYDRVVRRLNEFRKQGYAFGLVASLGEASVGAANDSVRSFSNLPVLPWLAIPFHSLTVL